MPGQPASVGAAAYRRRPPGPIEYIKVREITRFDNQPPVIRREVHLCGIVVAPQLMGCIARPQLAGVSLNRLPRPDVMLRYED